MIRARRSHLSIASLALALPLTLMACRGTKRADTTPGATSAVSSRATSAGAAAPAKAPDPVVDLLHTVDCIVAVSSKVDNPKDFPEHLVDGKPDTAWNGKTGDLAGSISFRVPKVSRVTRVELTAGFDKVGPKGDLFTMNHRITRVRLSRTDGAAPRVLVETSLDPTDRALQGVDIDEPGGDFALEVLATLPGTEKRWRELTVSEFRVLGRAGGAPANPSHVPLMTIGNLDGVKPHATSAKTAPVIGPFPTVASLCKAYDKAVAPAIDAVFPGDRYPGTIEGPHCKPLAKPDVSASLAQGPFLGGTFAALHDTEEAKARLLLQSASGFSPTNVVLWSRYHSDPGCMHGSNEIFEDARLVKTAAGTPVLVIRIVRKDVYWLVMDPTFQPVQVVETAYACQLDSAGAATCEGPLVTGTANSGYPDALGHTSPKLYAIDVGTTPWTSRREPVLGPAGDLRLAPP